MLVSLVLFSSFIIAFLTIPTLVNLAVKKNLNNSAKPVLNGLSKRRISNLGGVAIFVAFSITQSIFIEIPNFPFNYFTATLLFLFLVGLNDDLVGVRPINRLFAQFIASIIIVYFGGLYFSSFEGKFSIETFDLLLGLILSTLFIVGTINAYNLIDGVDGLAGSLGVVGSIFFSYLFYLSGDQGLMLFSLTFLGSLAGFLYFNISPAKIFLGDSGAYIIGFTFSIISIKLIEEVSLSPIQIASYEITSAYSVISAIIMVPVYDTLRLFTLRLYQNKNPFKGDYNHLHHILQRIGFSHKWITITFSLITVILFVSSVILQPFGSTLSIAILLLMMLGFNLVIYLSHNRYKRQSKIEYLELDE